MNFIASLWKNQQGLITMALGLLLAPLAKKLGIQLDPSVVYGSLGLIAAQVIGHHYKSATIAAAKLAAGVVDQIPAPAPLPVVAPVVPPVAS